jgi:hypothetical protein
MDKTNEYVLFDSPFPVKIKNNIKHPKIKRMLELYSSNSLRTNSEGLIYISDNQIFYSFYTEVKNCPLAHFYEFKPEVQGSITINNSSKHEHIKIDLNFYKQVDTTSTLIDQESYHEQAL